MFRQIQQVLQPNPWENYIVGVSFLGKFYSHKESNRFNQRIKQEFLDLNVIMQWKKRKTVLGDITRGATYKPNILNKLYWLFLLDRLHYADNYISHKCTILSKEKSTTVRITLTRITLIKEILVVLSLTMHKLNIRNHIKF